MRNLRRAQVVSSSLSGKNKQATDTKQKANLSKSDEPQVTDLETMQDNGYRCSGDLDNRLESVQFEVPFHSELSPPSSLAAMEHRTSQSHKEKAEKQAIDANEEVNCNPNLTQDSRKGERGSSNDRSMMCGHCKKAGHTRNLCWFLQPELRPVKKRGGERGGDATKKGRSEVICEHCKISGHKKERCWFLHPHLRPKWWKEGGDQRGGDQAEKSKWEKSNQRGGDQAHFGSEAGEGSKRGNGSGSNANGSVPLTREDLGNFLAQLGLLKPKPPNSGFFNPGIFLQKPSESKTSPEKYVAPFKRISNGLTKKMHQHG